MIWQSNNYIIYAFFRWIDRDKCEPIETYVEKWLDLGVTWIGGCCRTYASDVSRIGVEINKWLCKRERINESEL